MKSLLLIAALAIGLAACDDDKYQNDNNPVVSNESDNIVVRDMQRCSNGDMIPADQKCPPRTVPAS